MRRKTFVALGLLLVSVVMVVGTWLAADDMRAKPLVAHVTFGDGVVRVENAGSYAWHDLRLTINGEFVCVNDEPVAPGGSVGIDVIGCRSAAGQPLDWPVVRARDIAISVARVPRFPLLNRARTASGTYPLE